MPSFHYHCRTKMQHSLGIRENMKEERRNVRLRISTWFDIAINVCEGKNKASGVIMLYTTPPRALQALRKQEALKESKKKCPNHTLGSTYQRSTASVPHSEKITTNFFQKMSLIYGSHVTVKRQIIFISVLDPSVSARVSILLLTILKQTGDLLYTLHWKLA